MSDPFATALAALHCSAGAVAADFISADGSVVSIRAIRGQNSQTASYGAGQLVLDTNHVQIMRRDIADPTSGRLLLCGEEFVVQGAPLLDVEGLTWLCHLEPA